MSGVLTVFRHEWAGFFRGGVFLLFLLIVTPIGVAAAIGEYRAWQTEQRERAALQAQEVEQWLALDATHIHKAAHRGYFVIRDLPPGAILDRGVWDFGGSAIWLEAHRRNAALLRAADAAGTNARGVPRGVGPVLLWLTPLLLAVLLHGVVAGERARGSLAFAVSSGASPGTIVIGKTLAVVSLAWLAAAVPLVASLGLTLPAGLAPADGAFWSLTVLGGLGIYSAIVVIVSSTTRRPLGALVTLLLIWFAMTVLWPRLAAGLTNQIVPIPSSQTVRSQAEVAAEGLVSAETEAAVLAQLAAAGVADPNPSGVSALAAEIDASRTFAGIFAPLERGMARQATAMDLLSWVSPLAAADRAADARVGLGDYDQFAFEARAEAMRMATQTALNEGWARADVTGRGSPAIWRSVVDAANAVPDVESRASYAGAGLVLWIVLSAGGLAYAAGAIRKSI